MEHVHSSNLIGDLIKYIFKYFVVVAFDNEDFHSNGYSSGPRSTTSDIPTNESSQGFISIFIFNSNSFLFIGNPIRTVNWPELLPKITINIDPNRFHPISTGLKRKSYLNHLFIYFLYFN